MAFLNYTFIHNCETVANENSKVGELLRDVTISGQAFDVLMSVNAASKDFKWDMGFEHSGKGQLAKVDGGGLYLRCKAIIGGRQ